MKLASTLALVGLLAASGAQAMDLSDMYIGVNVGRSTVAIPDSAQPIGSPAAQSLSKNGSDTTYKVFMGSQVIDFLDVEGGYVSLGNWSATRTATAVGTNSATGKTQGIYFDGVGKYPISSSLSLLARLGYGYYWSQVDNTATGAVFYAPGVQSASSSAIVKGFQYGLGAQFNMSKNTALRAEWDRKSAAFVIDGKSVGTDNLSLGFLYKF